MTQNQNTCKICNKTFNSEQELREHERNMHSTGKLQGPGSEQGKRDKIAS